MRTLLAVILFVSLCATAQNARFIIVVDEAFVPIANAFCGQVHSNLYKRTETTTGTNTFVNPLGLTTNGPATHRWCNWQMDRSMFGFFTNKGDLLIRSPSFRVFNAATTTPEQVFSRMGLVSVELKD